MRSGKKENVLVASCSAFVAGITAWTILSNFIESLLVLFIIFVVVIVLTYKGIMKILNKTSACPKCQTTMDYSDEIINEKYAGQRISQKGFNKGKMVRVFEVTHKRVYICPKCGYVKEPSIFTSEEERL